jgi:hypothetical protein
LRFSKSGDSSNCQVIDGTPDIVATCSRSINSSAFSGCHLCMSTIFVPLATAGIMAE